MDDESRTTEAGLARYAVDYFKLCQPMLNGEIRITRVSRSADCGDSPKNKMAEGIAVALETRDTDFLSTILDPDAVWNYVGGTVTTTEAILEQLSALNTPTNVTIDRVMSHGKVGAVYGNARQGKSGQRCCHVIEFTSVKCNLVRRIESYGG